MGIDPDKYFGRVLFTGSHDANALAVANKRVDAATIADRIYRRGGAEEADRSGSRCTSCGAPARSRNPRRLAHEPCPTDLKRRSRTRS
jgi:hypothetical protein